MELMSIRFFFSFHQFVNNTSSYNTHKSIWAKSLLQVILDLILVLFGDSFPKISRIFDIGKEKKSIEGF